MTDTKSKIINWINDCFKEKKITPPVLLNWEDNYESSFSKGFLSQKTSVPFLIRDGLFSLFWHDYNGEKIPDGSLLPAESSRFLKNSPGQLFYRCEQVSPATTKPDYLLISLRPEPENFPLNLLQVGLESYKNEMRTFNPSKVFIHFSYSSESIRPADENYRTYIHFFYQIISEKLGFIPKLVSDVDLKRMGSMETWSFYSPEADWLIGDNFMEHFVLSKNAQLLKQYNSSFNEVKKTYALSPFHQIVVGTMKSFENSHLSNRYETFKKANPVLGNHKSIPEDFLNLVYSSRDKVR